MSRKKYGTRIVKKNCTIPAWLNARAEAIGVNFSQTLQEALLAKIEGIVHFRLDFWLTWCYSLHIGMSAQTYFRLITKSIKRIGEDDIYA